jgi:hypothetical protein
MTHAFLSTLLTVPARVRRLLAGPARPHRPAPRRLSFECLEDRVVPALTVFEAAGANAAAITAARDAFRTAVGGGTAAGANGSFGGVRREINWDGVPATFSAPNNLPANFFNVNSPRGAVFATPGTGFQVSGATTDAGAGQPAAARFGNLNAEYTTDFSVFSPQRLFTALGSNVTDVNFFVPGTTTPAAVSAFGAVFTDVDVANSTRLDFFSTSGVLLFSRSVLPGGTADGSESFLGVQFDAPLIARVRITSGAAALGAAVNDVSHGGTADLVVMDDFLYAEPTAVPNNGANNVTVQQIGTALIITGDNLSNNLTLDQPAFGQVRVAAGAVGTTVNGQATPQTFFGVSTVVVNANGGDDVVRILATQTDFFLPGALVVNGGLGNNQLLTSTGNNHHVTIGANLNYTSVLGTSTLSLTDTTVGGRFTVFTPTNLATTVTLTNVNVTGGGTSLVTGSGNDNVTINGSTFGGTFQLYTGLGNDTLNVQNTAGTTTFTGLVLANLGAGANTVGLATAAGSTVNLLGTAFPFGPTFVTPALFIIGQAGVQTPTVGLTNVASPFGPRFVMAG